MTTEILMPYTLHRLAAGSYDLILENAIVGGLVRDVAKNGDVRGWRAELMSDSSPLPAPFTREAHEFESYEAAVSWLGGSVVIKTG